MQGTAWYPFSRFRRLEFDVRVGFIDDALVSYVQDCTTPGFPIGNARYQTIGQPDVFFTLPTVAYVFDNTIYGYVGPYLGTKYRVALSQSIGTWQYTQLLLDYRRYTHIKGPVVFAFRGLFYGRRGPDANQFDVFIGTPDIVRGHTSGSYQRNECQVANSNGICLPLNRLVSQQLAVANFELRFPLLTPQMKFVPKGLPPIEGVAFFDAGLSWNQNSVIKWSLPDNDSSPDQLPGANRGLGHRCPDEPLRAPDPAARLVIPAAALALLRQLRDPEPRAHVLGRFHCRASAPASLSLAS